MIDWFKSNTIRYFELNEWKDNKNLDNNSRYTSFNFTQYYYNSNRDIFDNNVGARLDKQRSRYFHKNNGINKTTTQRHTFFINEVRNHYNNLNRDIYQPLSELGLNSVVNITTPSWISYLTVSDTLPDNFLTENGRLHITNDNNDLLEEINQYRRILKFYGENLKALPRIIDAVVKSKFIEEGIYPVKTGNYEKMGYYHFGDVCRQLALTWHNFLSSDRNIQSFIRDYNFNGLQFNEQGDHLKLGDFIIGRGTNEQRRCMRDVLNTIVRNHMILNAFNDLMRSKNRSLYSGRNNKKYGCTSFTINKRSRV